MNLANINRFYQDHEALLKTRDTLDCIENIVLRFIKSTFLKKRIMAGLSMACSSSSVHEFLSCVKIEVDNSATPSLNVFLGIGSMVTLLGNSYDQRKESVLKNLKILDKHIHEFLIRFFEFAFKLRLHAKLSKVLSHVISLSLKFKEGDNSLLMRERASELSERLQGLREDLTILLDSGKMLYDVDFSELNNAIPSLNVNMAHSKTILNPEFDLDVVDAEFKVAQKKNKGLRDLLDVLSVSFGVSYCRAGKSPFVVHKGLSIDPSKLFSSVKTLKEAELELIEADYLKVSKYFELVRLNKVIICQFKKLSFLRNELRKIIEKKSLLKRQGDVELLLSCELDYAKRLIEFYEFNIECAKNVVLYKKGNGDLIH